MSERKGMITQLPVGEFQRVLEQKVTMMVAFIVAAVLINMLMSGTNQSRIMKAQEDQVKLELRLVEELTAMSESQLLVMEVQAELIKALEENVRKD